MLSKLLFVGQEVVFQCRDEGPLRAKVEWIRDNGLPLPPGTRILDLGRLEIPDIQVNILLISLRNQIK